jgi:hypothetical protein
MGEHLLPWLTLGIAAFVAVIGALQFLTARKQWQTANDRAVFDQFKSRYEVYREFRDVVVKVTGGHIDQATWLKAAEAAERAQFLFGDEIILYLNQFVRELTDLQCLIAELEATTQADARKKNLEEQRRLRNKLQEFRNIGPLLFGKYIRFDRKLS